MKKAIKLIIIFTSVLMLSSCAHMNYSQKHYQKYVGTVSPVIVPKGLALKKGEPYYQVPKITTSAPAGPVSLIPPGSKVLQYRHSKNQKNQSALINSQWSYSRSGKTSLKLPITADVAWQKVNKALQKTPYKILDKDSTMKSFYVLDTESTDNSITQKTPIYRLFIEKSGKKASQIAVLNRRNQPVNPDIAKRILSAIKKDIS